VKFLEWAVSVCDYDLTDALSMLASMGCFSLKQEEDAEKVKRHCSYSICDIDWQILARYELFGEK